MYLLTSYLDNKTTCHLIFEESFTCCSSLHSFRMPFLAPRKVLHPFWNWQQPAVVPPVQTPDTGYRTQTENAQPSWLLLSVHMNALIARQHVNPHSLSLITGECFSLLSWWAVSLLEHNFCAHQKFDKHFCSSAPSSCGRSSHKLTTDLHWSHSYCNNATSLETLHSISTASACFNCSNLWLTPPPPLLAFITLMNCLNLVNRFAD